MEEVNVTGNIAGNVVGNVCASVLQKYDTIRQGILLGKLLFMQCNNDPY